MNWKQEAADKLRQYACLRTACCNLPREIQRLRVEAGRIKRASAEPVSTKGCRGRGDTELLNNIVYRQELEWALERSKSLLTSTEQALDTLSREERRILNYLYISPESGGVQRLCQELGIEKSSAYRQRDRALEKFTIALYGTPDDGLPS